MTERHVVEYGPGKRAACSCGRELRAKTWRRLFLDVARHVRPGFEVGSGRLST